MLKPIFPILLLLVFRIVGLNEVRDKGNRSILFMLNHPIFIDPIMMSQLVRDFTPGLLAGEVQAGITLILSLMKTSTKYSLESQMCLVVL
jgi:hypothetical protein